MLIFHESQKFSDFARDPKPQLSRHKKFKVATYLIDKKKPIAVVLSPKVFEQIESELLVLGLNNSTNELLLEEFRIGKLSPEALRKSIRPNPKALGIPAEEVFAKLRIKFKLRKEQRAKRSRVSASSARTQV